MVANKHFIKKGLSLVLCYYCEEEIKEGEEEVTLQNDKTGQIVHVHYPYCKVAFTTFRKTKKEFAEWKANKLR